jgi:hypothetical protein
MKSCIIKMLLCLAVDTPAAVAGITLLRHLMLFVLQAHALEGYA